MTPMPAFAPDDTAYGAAPAYGTPPQRSQEWLTLIDEANHWQQTYDVLLHCQGDPHCSQDRLSRAAATEQAAYDAWCHALVAFERAENRRAGRI